MSFSNPRALLAALHGAAVQGAAPFSRTRDAVRAWWEAKAFPEGVPVHIFALGKASPAMAAGAVAALEALRVPIAGGVIVSAHVPGEHDWNGVHVPDRIDRRQGDHPVPGPASLDAADAIDDAILAVDEPGTVAIVLLSGGTTALCAAPIPALSLAVGDTEAAQAVLANLAQTLLESGLAIHEMNAIRRRVLRFGAGRLAVALANRQVRHIGTFAISDVIGDDPAVIGSGPCSADPLDDAHFLALLDAHDLRPRLQRAMGAVLGLEGANPPPSVPGAHHPGLALVDYTLVARNADAVGALAQAAEVAGIDTILVDQAPLEGDADALGEALARRALLLARTVPTGAAALLISGGEPVVNLRDTIERAMQRGDEDDARLAEYGEAARLLMAASSAADEPMSGGRMQVLALCAALVLEQAAAQGDPHARRITVLAAGTDGRDGPTDAAGAIVDAAVPALARRHGRSPEADLASGRSYFPLDAADALLRSGPTGTNVMDVVAILIRG